jgi:hypothetical protein
MPYRSKVDRERPLWMTLGEALAHIQAHLVQGSCDQLSAETELRMACGEGEIPLRWAADPPPQGLCFFESFGLHSLFAADEVPTSPLYWRQVLIFGDRVVDQSFSSLTEADSPPERAPRQRELFLLRSRVLELWPLRSDAHEGASAKGHSGSADQIPRQQSPATEGEILNTVRELYRQAGNDPPNQTKAEQLVAALLPGTKRDFIRSILQRPEFHNVRRKPGRQPQHRKPGGQPAR